MSKNNIVDLERAKDGTYVPKNSKASKSSKPPKNIEHRNEYDYKSKNEADEFLGGLDIGLDFLEGIVPRIDRFMKLKG